MKPVITLRKETQALKDMGPALILELDFRDPRIVQQRTISRDGPTTSTSMM